MALPLYLLSQAGVLGDTPEVATMIYDYISITHEELIDMCVERGLITRPKVIREGCGWTYVDKLWRKRELLDMLLEAEE